MSFFCLALSALSALSLSIVQIVQIVQCDFFIFAIHLPNAMGQEIILKKPSKKDTSFSLRSNPRGYSREPLFSVYARALCVLEITSRRIISSAFLRSVRGTIMPRFLHTSSIVRHGMPLILYKSSILFHFYTSLLL